MSAVVIVAVLIMLSAKAIPNALPKNLVQRKTTFVQKPLAVRETKINVVKTKKGNAVNTANP